MLPKFYWLPLDAVFRYDHEPQWQKCSVSYILVKKFANEWKRFMLDDVGASEESSNALVSVVDKAAVCAWCDQG